MSSYPSAIKNFLSLEDGVDKVIAQHPNERGDEITAIETELGTDPAGNCADLKTRLAVGINNDGTLKLFGDSVDKSSSYGAQQAATDGIVEGYMEYTTAAGDWTATFSLYTDANADPSALKIKAMISQTGSTAQIGMNHCVPFSMSVKKGNYWKGVLSGSTPTTLKVFWRPSTT